MTCVLSLQAYDALPPGGAFISLDTIIDDGRCRNVWGLLMSLDMLMEFEQEGSADYTFEVCWVQLCSAASAVALSLDSHSRVQCGNRARSSSNQHGRRTHVQQ